jgi:hypothetical protein
VRLLLVLTALAVFLLLPGLLFGPSLDAAVFVHVAGRLADGVPPYTGAWDHKPPGIYLLLAGASSMLPFADRWVVSWVLSLAATVGTGLLIAAILRRLGVSRGGAGLAAASAVVVMAQYLTSLGGGMTEPLAALAAAGALALAVHDRPGVRRLAGVGLLLAISVLISVQAAAAALPITALAYVRAEARLTRMAAAGILVASGLAPLLVVLGWLYAIGATGDAVSAVVGYGAAYRAINVEHGGQLSAPVVAWNLLAWLFLILPAGLGLLAALRAGGRGWLVASLASWIVIGLALFVFQIRFFSHYAIPLAVPLGILAGLGYERLRALMASRPAIRPRAALMAPFLVTLVVSMVAGTSAGLSEMQPVARNASRIERVADTLRGLAASPGSPIFVWGNHPSLYEAADRSPATRYSYLYPLVTPGYTTPELIDATLAELEAHPPAVVVDASTSRPGEPGFQPLLMPHETISDGRDLDLLDPLRGFVRSRYRLVGVVDGWPIYELTHAGDPDQPLGHARGRRPS